MAACGGAACPQKAPSVPQTRKPQQQIAVTPQVNIRTRQRVGSTRQSQPIPPTSEAAMPPQHLNEIEQALSAGHPYVLSLIHI